MPETDSAEVTSEVVNGFPPGAVLRRPDFHGEILGYQVGTNFAGVFVKSFDGNGDLVIKFVPWIGSTLVQAHGLVGRAGLLEAKLQSGQFERRQLSSLLISSDPKTTARLLEIAGQELGNPDKNERERIVIAFNRLGRDDFQTFVQTSQHDWLVRIAINLCEDLEFLRSFASTAFMTSVRWKVVRMGKRRLVELEKRQKK